MSEPISLSLVLFDSSRVSGTSQWLMQLIFVVSASAGFAPAFEWSNYALLAGWNTVNLSVSDKLSIY